MERRTAHLLQLQQVIFGAEGGPSLAAQVVLMPRKFGLIFQVRSNGWPCSGAWWKDAEGIGRRRVAARETGEFQQTESLWNVEAITHRGLPRDLVARRSWALAAKQVYPQNVSRRRGT